jgi:Zn-dependent peptidase ImmA (M78 family)
MNKIIKKVNELLHSFKINKPPIPITKIAETHNAKISYSPYYGTDNILGMLYQDGKNTIIGINSKLLREQQRFVIAYEIGNLIFGHKDIYITKSINLISPGNSKNKIPGNFAMELLMPFDLLEAELISMAKLKTAIIDDHIIDHLSKKFCVSTAVTKIRLSNSGILIIA